MRPRSYEFWALQILGDSILCPNWDRWDPVCDGMWSIFMLTIQSTDSVRMPSSKANSSRSKSESDNPGLFNRSLSRIRRYSRSKKIQRHNLKSIQLKRKWEPVFAIQRTHKVPSTSIRPCNRILKRVSNLHSNNPFYYQHFMHYNKENRPLPAALPQPRMTSHHRSMDRNASGWSCSPSVLHKSQDTPTLAPAPSAMHQTLTDAASWSRAAI